MPKRPKHQAIKRPSTYTTLQQLQQTYPHLQRIHMELTGGKYGKPDEYGLDTIYDSAKGQDLPTFLSCQQTLCAHGGFDIGAVLRDALAKGMAEHIGSAVCRGREDVRDCLAVCNVKTTIEMAA